MIAAYAVQKSTSAARVNSCLRSHDLVGNVLHEEHIVLRGLDPTQFESETAELVLYDALHA
jgi:hypothetical protein